MYGLGLRFWGLGLGPGLQVVEFQSVSIPTGRLRSVGIYLYRKKVGNEPY